MQNLTVTECIKVLSTAERLVAVFYSTKQDVDPRLNGGDISPRDITIVSQALFHAFDSGLYFDQDVV
jgi:hypothetical protein